MTSDSIRILRVLAEFEWRQFAHRFDGPWWNKLRLGPFLFIPALYVIFAPARYGQSKLPLEVYASYSAGLVWFALGIRLLTASGNTLPTFNSAGELFLFRTSGVPSTLAFLWLRLRTRLKTIGTGAIGLLVLTLWSTSGVQGDWALGFRRAALTQIALASVYTYGAVLGVYALRYSRAPLVIAAIPCFILALGEYLSGVVHSQPGEVFTSLHVPHWLDYGGMLMAQSFRGNLWYLGVATVVAYLLWNHITRVTDAAYPVLYERFQAGRHGQWLLRARGESIAARNARIFADGIPEDEADRRKIMRSVQAQLAMDDDSLPRGLHNGAKSAIWYVRTIYRRAARSSAGVQTRILLMVIGILASLVSLPLPAGNGTAYAGIGGAIAVAPLGFLLTPMYLYRRTYASAEAARRFLSNALWWVNTDRATARLQIFAAEFAGVSYAWFALGTLLIPIGFAAAFRGSALLIALHAISVIAYFYGAGRFATAVSIVSFLRAPALGRGESGYQGDGWFAFALAFSGGILAVAVMCAAAGYTDQFVVGTCAGALTFLIVALLILEVAGRMIEGGGRSTVECRG
jgi:hypothetical protein